MNKTTTIEKMICVDETLQRPRYYPRLIMTPQELTLEDRYLRDRMRRHNRLLHGWGVVCGADVCRMPNADGTAAEPWQVRVIPGYALGPRGDEILIRQATTVYLNRANATATAADPLSTAPDPWCSDIPTDCPTGPFYIAVRYVELRARPVQVSLTGCGCGDTSCEYSRLCDGYEFGVFDHCPTYPTNALESLDAVLHGVLSDCPDCPDDDWVYLARVEVDADGNVTTIDNCDCRRMVVSFASAWWQCQERVVAIDKVYDADNPGAQPIMLEQGKSYTVIVEGKNLDGISKAGLGSKIDVKVQPPPAADKVTLAVSVAADADAGNRALVLESKDCAAATYANAAQVQSAAAAPPPGTSKGKKGAKGGGG